MRRSYTLENLREYLVLYTDEYLLGDAEDFVNWLARCLETDAILRVEPEDIASLYQSEPVDLFGVGGVAGVAMPDELDRLRMMGATGEYGDPSDAEVESD